MIESLSNIMPAVWTSDQGSYFLYSHSDKIPTLLLIFFFTILILAALVLVLWIAMPFSVFSMKRELKHCVIEQKKTNTLLQKLLEEKSEGAKSASKTVPLKEEPRDF